MISVFLNLLRLQSALQGLRKSVSACWVCETSHLEVARWQCTALCGCGKQHLWPLSSGFMEPALSSCAFFLWLLSVRFLKIYRFTCSFHVPEQHSLVWLVPICLLGQPLVTYFSYCFWWYRSQRTSLVCTYKCISWYVCYIVIKSVNKW